MNDDDKTVPVARITSAAQRIFAARADYAAEWLHARNTALGGRTPMQALVTKSGAGAVAELLFAPEYGMFG